ncbi:MAG TPA: hypothetical protein VHZ07_02210 [Bryobacteraceae bacterium]|jgi:hypothetical protein|nr:hypothetical protein [Bryobacteraceae bacterium]
MAAPPKKLYDENSVAKLTCYVSIDLGSQAQASPTTGIFIPDGYNAGDEVDMILWLMGHHDNSAYPPSLSIDDYWFKYTHFRFREFVNSGQKNVILAAPSLGPGSQSGSLINRGGLAAYIDQVLAALQAYGPFTSLPTLGQLVIACHSGGGAPMREIATTTQQYSPNLRELWGFDCLYGGSDDSVWTNWAKGNAYKRLRVRYGSGGTANMSLSLKRMASKLANVNVDGSTGTEHNKVPVTYWYEFMRKATFFLDK